MEGTYQYAWIIPFVPLIVTMLIGLGLLLIPTATKNIRRIWAFPSILLLTIVMAFSTKLSIQQINSSFLYEYLWPWIINSDFCLEVGYLIDPLTSIMLMLITTVGILVLIYSDGYMSHDQGYFRFFAYISFFTASMLGLVTSPNFIQLYIFWELVGMCSYLLIGFWFTRPIAATACQKAFITNRVADFGLLVGILGCYFMTGSFEFRDLCKILNHFIHNNDIHSLFAMILALLLFLGAIAKSAQFPLHIWLPDAMEGPTPISALIHAATMVAAGIFLVARLFPLFELIPYLMNMISLIGLITILLGSTLALAERDIKKGLAYSTMSQLGYMMLALGIGSYRAALFHLITHAYTKALLFLGSGSIIHSMEAIVGYSPAKSQNMVLMGGLKRYMPITKTTFLLGTLSLSGIPPLACFWSKDEILNDSWLYSPIFGVIACYTAGLTAFYMFRLYLLTFEGHLRLHFQNYSGYLNGSLYSISVWGKKGSKSVVRNFLASTINNDKNPFSFSNPTTNIYEIAGYVTKMQSSFSGSFLNKDHFLYPHESDNTLLFPLIILVAFTLFIECIGVPFVQKGIEVDILSKWLTPAMKLLHENSSVDWYQFTTKAIYSVTIACLGIYTALLLYGSVYSPLQNLDFINFFCQQYLRIRILLERIINLIYNWSYNRAYIDLYYEKVFIKGIRGLSEIVHYFDQQVLDGIANGIGITSFFIGEGIKYFVGGRISSYLFFYFFFVSIFLFLLFSHF
uniref:NAD(P)H-quinone oxidoreductase subunit 5, chloroplastic n=3 Tax=Trithuria inconspicua TaxID=405043 RepID=M1X138_9MAGN|nr:NdhF [Trithuria inconspicua]QHO62389.1 NADH dehydrogenase subunit F [Trithuria inconspicua subsp. brevistyla]CCJ32574.1 NdhF [Trithuria inconspicua]